MSKNVVPLKTGKAIAGIIPTNIEEVFRLATAVAKSGMAPRDMQTPEKLTVAIMHGLEIGLQPMQAIQKIAVINGRPTVWGDAVPALLWSHGVKLEERIEGDGDNRTAYCKVTRPDGSNGERSFGVLDAKKAGLWGKKGPWEQYPDRMLQMRARGFAARDMAPDALGGMYVAEEVQDITPMRDVTPIDDAEVISDEQQAELRDIIAKRKLDIDDVLGRIKEDCLADILASKFDRAKMAIERMEPKQ